MDFLDLDAIALPLMMAILATVGVIGFAVGILSKPKTITTVTGEKRFAPSDLEKMLKPLFDRLISRRAGGRAQLARELQWNRSRLTPEAFTLLPFVLTPAGALGFFAISKYLLEFDTDTSIMLAGLGALMGWFYLRATHNGKIRRRQARVKDDAIIFIGQYGRTAVSARDMVTIFSEMNKFVLDERARQALRAGTVGGSRRRNRGGPYDAEVWRGLSDMMARSGQGLVRDGATLDDPDLLQEFAIFCDDYDMTNFLMQLRQAALQHRTMSADQIEQQVRELRALRIDEIKASEAGLQLKATVYLVFFNLIILFAAMLLPFIAPYLGGFVSGTL